MWRSGGRPGAPFQLAIASLPMLRFHIPLIEPDGRFSRIRLSDQKSRLRPREPPLLGTEPHQPQYAVQVLVGVQERTP